jgi:tetratricopeptide (TPR) repeat protein
MVKWIHFTPLVGISALLSGIWLWLARSRTAQCKRLHSDFSDEARDSASQTIRITDQKPYIAIEVESPLDNHAYVEHVRSQEDAEGNGNHDEFEISPSSADREVNPNPLFDLLRDSHLEKTIPYIFSHRGKLSEPKNIAALIFDTISFDKAKKYKRKFDSIVEHMRGCELDTAAQLLDQTLNRRTTLSAHTDGRKVISLALSLKGWIFAALDMLEDAQRMYWESVQTWLADGSIDHDPFLHLLLMDLASICSALEKYDLAEQLYMRAQVAASDGHLPIERQALALLCLADVFRSSHHHQRMHRALTACQRLLRSSETSSRPAVHALLCAAAEFELAGLRWARGDAAAGERLDAAWVGAVAPVLAKSATAREAAGRLRRVLLDLGHARQGQGNPAHAVPLLRRAVDLSDSGGGGGEGGPAAAADGGEASEALLALSEALRRSGRLDEALEVPSCAVGEFGGWGEGGQTGGGAARVRLVRRLLLS